MITLKKTMVGAVVAFAAFFGLASSAQALTLAELNAYIAQGFTAEWIMANVGGSTSGSTGSTTCGTTYGYTATSTLRSGMKGAAVSSLQAALRTYGGATITVDGSFGPATANAVRAFQASKGLGADGIAGPATQGALQTASMTTGNCPGTPTTPGTISGTEGDLTFDVVLDSDVQIDLGKAENVIEVEFEAEDGDVMVDRVDFMFDSRPWLYFSEVNLLANGKEIASLSSSNDFSEVSSGDWRARFSGLKQIVKKDQTVVFALEVKVLGSMAGTRANDIVEVTMDNTSVRFTDGSGAVFQDGMAIGPVDVTFDDVFGQGDIALAIGDNSPENGTIVLNETTRKNDVTVLEFTAEADDSDMNVTKVDVKFSSTGSSVAETLYRAYLYRGNNQLKSKSVSGNTVSFDDLDYTIEEGDEETFTVKVDFNRGDSFGFDEFTVEDVQIWADNSDYEEKTDTLTVAEDHQLVMAGLVDAYTNKSADSVSLGNSTNAKFAFTFDLTAYEENYFLAENASDFGITIGGSTTGVSILSRSLTSNATEVADAFRVNKGQTRTFTLTVELQTTSTTGQSVNVTIDDLEYYTNSGLSAGAATLNLGGTEYKSNNVSIIHVN